MYVVLILRVLDIMHMNFYAYIISMHIYYSMCCIISIPGNIIKVIHNIEISFEQKLNGFQNII